MTKYLLFLMVGAVLLASCSTTDTRLASVGSGGTGTTSGARPVDASVMRATEVIDRNPSASGNTAGVPLAAPGIQVKGLLSGVNWSAGGAIRFTLQGIQILAPEGTYGSCSSYGANHKTMVTVEMHKPAAGEVAVANRVICTLPVSTPDPR